MSMLNQGPSVRAQYRDSTHFNARVDLHVRYSTNPYGWTKWIFDSVGVSSGERALEVGGGQGWLWRGYPDALEVPEAEPVVSYVRSMSSFWDLSDELAAKLRSAVDAAVQRDGTFHISKDAGVITARRR